MKWRIVAASSPGEIHLESDSPKGQDYFLTDVRHLPDNSAVLLCVLADGAGSASEGLAGAEVACKAGINMLWKNIRKAGSVTALGESELHNWFAGIRKQLSIKSEAMQISIRELASTFLCVAVGDDSACCVQVGDGAIVLDNEDSWVCVFPPDTGEYANTTHFITDDDTQDHLHIKFVTPTPNRVALFSDGLQRLALKFEAESISVHVPFFEPMFAVLDKTKSSDECEKLSKELEGFLAGSKISFLTDDDRTLVLASRVNSQI